MRLADIDGFEVARRHAANGGAAVVLTSGRDRSDYGSPIDDSSALGFVPKGELSRAALDALRRG